MTKAPFQALIVLCLLAITPNLAAQSSDVAEPKIICSLNGLFCASSTPDTKVTTIVRRRAGGIVEPLWSMKGYFPVAFLSNDGEYLVTGYPGGGVLPADYKKNLVFLSFYDRGRLLNEVRLNEVVSDLSLSKMPKIDNQYRWGVYLGLNVDDYLTVQTFDQNWLLFNMKTGQVVK